MHIVSKQYTEEFTRECRAEFGLDPMQIRKMIALLSVNKALDVEHFLKQVDELKIAVHESSVLIERMSKVAGGVERLGGF